MTEKGNGHEGDPREVSREIVLPAMRVFDITRPNPEKPGTIKVERVMAHYVEFAGNGQVLVCYDYSVDRDNDRVVSYARRAVRKWIDIAEVVTPAASTGGALSALTH